MRIVDAHCHVPSSKFTPMSFIRASVTNRVAMLAATGLSICVDKLLDQVKHKMEDHDADGMVAEMDQAGIDEAVLLCPDFSYALKDCELTAEECLQAHRAILNRHAGRFHVFAGVDPRWGKDGIELFKKAVNDWGFSGLKLYPPCGYTASDELLYPYYEICDELNLPVLVHTGPTSPALQFDTSHPMQLDEAARRFSRVNFILAHAPIAYPEECVMMATYRPNVYVDISGFQKCLAAPEMVISNDLGRVMGSGIQHKVLFGTDWPVFQDYGTVADAVAYATSDEDNPISELPESQLRMVMSGNIDRLLDQSART